MPRIPLIEDLTKEPIPLGSNLLVEFDPASQWYNASFTIAAGWIRSGGVSSYNVYDQPPENVRLRLKRLGLDIEAFEKEGKFRILDWYTFQLGQKSQEKYAETSLKVADQSIIAKQTLLATGTRSPYPGTDYHLGPDVLRIGDCEVSVYLRFNDEKSYIDYWRTREIPVGAATKSTEILGAVKGIHSEYLYKSIEASADGIIDFKFDDSGEEPKNLMRIRAMRNVGFDGRWHQLKTDDRFEVALEK